MDGASAELWSRKAAKYVEKVNTAEGGASRSLSDIHNHALNMAKFYGAKVPVQPPVSTKGRAKTHRIVR